MSEEIVEQLPKGTGGSDASAIGRYRLKHRIGKGGMGLVYAAHDPTLHRDVAIKILRPGSKEEDASLANPRLLREARAIARLHHPNVVAVYDVGVHDERIFIAMELVEGTSLREWAVERRDWREVIAVALQAAEGLAAAHQAGMIHRDFKPENVLVGNDGRARVVDFGLARPPVRVEGAADALGDEVLPSITATGAAAGTPGYMAPEQLVGGPLDPRVDQYAFCVTVYEALFGQRPFVGETVSELIRSKLRSVVEFPPESSRLPSELLEVLSRGLSRQREDRYRSMEDLSAALRKILADAGPPRWTDSSLTAGGESRRATSQMLRSYLLQLPDGIASHPRCMMRARLIRLALSHHPLEGDLPSEIDLALTSVTRNAQWVPCVHGRAILAEIFERNFTSFEEWGNFVRRLFRATQLSGFLGFMVAPVQSQTLLDTAARSFGELIRGPTLVATAAGSGRGRVVVEHPDGLLDRLAEIEVASYLRVALESAGVHYADADPVSTAPGRLELELRWA